MANVYVMFLNQWLRRLHIVIFVTLSICFIIIAISYFKWHQEKHIVEIKIHKSTQMLLPQNDSRRSQQLSIPKQHWVKATLRHLLGNQLFIAASSYAIAKARNARWCIEILPNEDILIDTILDWVEKPEPCPVFQPEAFTLVVEHLAWTNYQEKFVECCPNQSIHVKNYFQSYKYWTNHDVQIPFQLKKKTWGMEWAKNNSVRVGIHIRRADYEMQPKYRKFMPPTLYYEICIHYILKQTKHGIPKSSFWVTSDDMLWVQSQSIFEGMQMSTFAQADEIMSILNACEHMISSTGTFSWWSMYMMQNQGGIQMYYHYEDYLDVPSDYDMKDFYPSSWVGVELIRKSSFVSI